MASITKEANGRRTIQFVGGDSKRRSIRLGKTSQRTAETIKLRVEALNAARIAGHAVDEETARWLAGIEDSLADKLASVGLVPRRENRSGTLGEWIESYIASRTDLKPRTRNNLEQAQGFLIEYFGASKSLRSITPGDADELRRWMLERLGANTVRRHLGRAKQFFRAAQRKKLLAENPFADLKDCSVKANPERFYFVTSDMAQKVLDACPDAEWRTIFALCRFGGLRCPSEVLAIT